MNPNHCEQVRPIPLLHVHGKNDGIVAYGSEWEWKAWDSVGTMRDIPGLISSWASKYNCAEVTDTMTENVQHVAHSGCARDSRVELYGLGGQDHDWPQAINGIPMHQVLWNFLREFQLD